MAVTKTVESENLATCNVTIGDLKFSKVKNETAGTVTVDSGTIKYVAGPQTDYFRAPDGSIVNSSSVIFTEVDNTKPFIFTAKVKPEFTETGTYSAGVLYAYENDSHCQKLCFGQSEDGLHRVVTVRTIGTSDDNNHQIIPGKYVYLRISSDGQTIGNYYSEDGEKWHLARLYKNDFPEKLFLGISSPSPKDDTHTCYFSEVSLINRATCDFRNGKLEEE